MAKQTGEIKIVGTIGGITFYKMGKEFFAREKSDITAKRFWQDKAFARSRKCSTIFGDANKLASYVYNSLSRERRYKPLYLGMERLAILLLNGGKSEVEVIRSLRRYAGLDG